MSKADFEYMLNKKIEEIESKLTSSQRKNSRSQSKGGDEE